MKNTTRSPPVYFLFLIGMAHFGQGTISINCPEISYLGVSTDITCITSVPFTTVQFGRLSEGVFPQCSALPLRCTPATGYKAIAHSNTYITLMVLNVQPTHTGQWTCADAGGGSEASCSLFITNVPRCHIRSDQNTDTLTLHEELSLTVDIQEYYCSAQYTFSLLVGNDNVHLPISEPVNTSTSTTASTTVNITSSSLGGVRLAFRCHGEQQILSCDGIKFINVAPGCRVISGKAIKTVALHEELEISVDIKNYFCSASNNFTLQVGKVSQPLSAAAIGNRLRNMTVNITLKITDLHFGDVRLIFLCQDQKQVLTCDGLELIQVLEDKATRNRTSMAVIIGSVVAGIVIVTIIITLVVVLMKMNRSKQTQQPDKHVYDSTDDVARETNDTSGHEYNVLYLTALERDTSYYNVISN